MCGQGKLFAMEEPVTPCKLVKMLLDGKREGRGKTRIDLFPRCYDMLI